jgi:hypothetical protein
MYLPMADTCMPAAHVGPGTHMPDMCSNGYMPCPTWRLRYMHILTKLRHPFMDRATEVVLLILYCEYTLCIIWQLIGKSPFLDLGYC